MQTTNAGMSGLKSVLIIAGLQILAAESPSKICVDDSSDDSSDSDGDYPLSSLKDLKPVKKAASPPSRFPDDAEEQSSVGKLIPKAIRTIDSTTNVSCLHIKLMTLDCEQSLFFAKVCAANARRSLTFASHTLTKKILLAV